MWMGSKKLRKGIDSSHLIDDELFRERLSEKNKGLKCTQQSRLV